MGRGRALNRIVVGGISGAGKTTLAAALAARLRLRHIEIDALFHGPGWEPRPTFVTDVDEATRGTGWLADSFGYSAVADLLWSRCDTFVWVDYARPVVMVRVLRRSLARATYARELWNGNREGFVDWLDPEHPIRWAWAQHRSRRARTEARIADPRWAGIRVVHLPNPAATRRWLTRVESVR